MITWIFSGLVVVAMSLVLISFAADPSLIDEVYSSDSRFADSGLTADRSGRAPSAWPSSSGWWALASAALAVLVMPGPRLGALRARSCPAALASLLTLVMVLAAAGAAAGHPLRRGHRRAAHPPRRGAWFAQRTGPTP